LIVLDSCSTDGTVEVLKKYDTKIDKLIVEKDNGQYFAVKRGFELSSGEIIAWINGDDKYFPWTFSFVNKIFTEHTDINWIGGLPSFMNEHAEIYGLNNTVPSRPNKYIKEGWFRDRLYGYLQQEGMFWRKKSYVEIGGIDTQFKLAADFDLWIRLSQKNELISVGIPLACFRVHENSRSKVLKTIYENEVNQITQRMAKPPYFIKILFGINPNLNAILRKFIWKKSKIYYFSLKDKKWKLRDKFTSISTHPFSHILLK
jgi:glycosyltransferase involved in cell wall biosynthesis